MDLHAEVVYFEMRYDALKEDLEKHEKAFKRREIEQRRHLDHLQKKLNRIRTAAIKVRAGEVPIEKLFKEILHGNVR